MALSFRSRLFRLLLLFAAVPSITLTVIGYYLSTDPAPLPPTEIPSATNELRDYFYEILYADIDLALDDYLDHGMNLTGRLDFAVRLDSLAVVAETDSLPDEVVARLQEIVPRQEKGLVDAGDRFYQFVARRTAAGYYLVGGVIHDSSLAVAALSSSYTHAADSARQELRATYVLFLGLLFLVLISVAIVAAYLFSSRVSRNLAEPVAALSRASMEIAAGDFKQDVKVTASGEIGMLITNFNRMATQLDQVSSRLLQTERVAAWRQVARRFAHELKNPLQPILVSLYRIEQQLSATDVWSQVEEPLRAAREEVQHLTQLAERFSNLAKLPPPSIQGVDLSELVASTTSLYHEKLAPFKFELALPDQPMFAQTDAGFVREALHNLLQNAIDACQPGDRIELRLEQRPETIELALRDAGIGMDSETMASARLPYFTTKSQGNGLGLAIVERSMAELGGQLRVASDKGSGTVVTLIFPRETG